jgi:hypothetical protein
MVSFLSGKYFVFGLVLSMIRALPAAAPHGGSDRRRREDVK